MSVLKAALLKRRLLSNDIIKGGLRMAVKAKTEIKFEIVKNVGTISEGSKGWKKELNVIKWNDRDPKYDLRDWSPDHTKMGKGITLTKEEVAKLKEVLALAE